MACDICRTYGEILKEAIDRVNKADIRPNFKGDMYRCVDEFIAKELVNVYQNLSLRSSRHDINDSSKNRAVIMADCTSNTCISFNYMVSIRKNRKLTSYRGTRYDLNKVEIDESCSEWNRYKDLSIEDVITVVKRERKESKKRKKEKIRNTIDGLPSVFETLARKVRNREELSLEDQKKLNKMIEVYKFYFNKDEFV